MDKFIIKGPTKLKGEVSISGSKNAALPIMTACIAKPGIYRLKNVPNLRDTRTMVKLLKIIGCKVSKTNNILKSFSSIFCCPGSNARDGKSRRWIDYQYGLD